jgi:hypothetical protein
MVGVPVALAKHGSTLEELLQWFDKHSRPRS